MDCNALGMVSNQLCINSATYNLTNNIPANRWSQEKLSWDNISIYVMFFLSILMYPSNICFMLSLNVMYSSCTILCSCCGCCLWEHIQPHMNRDQGLLTNHRKSIALMSHPNLSWNKHIFSQSKWQLNRPSVQSHGTSWLVANIWDFGLSWVLILQQS